MTVEEIPAALSAFLAAMGARDAAVAATQLADYVILENPIETRPIVGREPVATALSQSLAVIDEYTVTDIIPGDGYFVVVTNIRISTTELDGVDLIGVNPAGKVASLAVHLRPTRAIVELQNRLAPTRRKPLHILPDTS
ncbi:hypothetical protein [Mycobacterium sp. C31M]